MTEAFMNHFTIDISETAHQTLQDLSKQTGQPLNEILDKAVEDFRRKQFLEEANRAYARLKNNPQAWAEELEERRAWDVTLGDGLEDL
jgi:hypothetical protein